VLSSGSTGPERLVRRSPWRAEDETCPRSVFAFFLFFFFSFSNFPPFPSFSRFVLVWLLRRCQDARTSSSSPRHGDRDPVRPPGDTAASIPTCRTPCPCSISRRPAQVCIRGGHAALRRVPGSRRLRCSAQMPAPRLCAALPMRFLAAVNGLIQRGGRRQGPRAHSPTSSLYART